MFEGNCDAALHVVRQYVSADRSAPEGHFFLADALLGAGEPLESVRTALTVEIDRSRPLEAQ
jgi:hypothetical protein